MTVIEQIDWISSPDSSISKSDKLRISVTMRPLLKFENENNGEDKTLKRFPKFINWPNTVKSLTFTITITDHNDVEKAKFPGQIPLYVEGEPEPNLWAGFLSKDTLVRPIDENDFNVSFERVRSYPVSEISSYIDKLYKEIAIQTSNDILTTRNSLGFMDRPKAFGGTYEADQGEPCDIVLEGELKNRSKNSTFLTFKLAENVPENIGKFELDDEKEFPYKQIGHFTPYFEDGKYTLRYFAITDFGTKSDIQEIEIFVGTPHRNNINNTDITNNNKKINNNDKSQEEFEDNPLNLTNLIINRYNKNELERKTETIFKNGKVIPPIGIDDELSIKHKFYFLKSYYDLLSNPKISLQNIEKNNSLGQNNEEFDFHDYIEWLNEYPVISRKIGLIFDFEIEYDTKIPFKGKIQIKPDNGSLGSGYWTSYEIVKCANKTLKFFVDTDDKPQMNEDEYNKHGMLVLNQNYDIITKDVAGSASQLINLANNLADLPEDDIKEHRLNTIISNGFSLVENKRSFRLMKHFSYLSSRNFDYFFNLDGGTLTARDLIKGHRIDVWDSNTKKWHSLCFRNGTYKIKNFGMDKTIKKIDEGFISIGVSTPVTDAHINEALFKWKGWSLSVPPVGKTVSTKENIPTYPNEPDPSSMGNSILTLPSTFLVTFDPIIDKDKKEKKLPKLRFGQKYRFRARSVDIAGNSLDLNDQIDDKYGLPSDAIPYLRYEPIAEPLIISQQEINPKKQPGEAEDTLVIRSDYDKTVFEYSKLHGFIYPTYSERFLAPPKISQEMAEMHGMFDNLKWYRNDFPPIDGIFRDIQDDPSIFDESDYEKGYNVLVNKEKGIAQYDIKNHILRLEYLPDPLAHGIVFQNLFDNTPKIFGGKWPGIYSIKVRLEDETGNLINSLHTKSSHNHETIIRSLGKGDVVETMISCFISTKKDGENPRSLLAIYNQLKIPSDEFLKFNKLIDEGKNWLVAPARKIRLIHAVQRPLRKPEFDDLSVLRSTNSQGEIRTDETTVIITGKISVSRKTTSKVEIFADWEDIKEEEIGLDKVPSSDPVGEILIDEPDINNSDTDIVPVSIPNIKHELDTKYRRVTYRAVATSRFQKYFNDDGSPDFFTQHSPNNKTFDILHTGIPEAPKIPYDEDIIPSFRWEEIPNQNYLKRHSGGLRVYLEGPWFSSGEKELLGVVIPYFASSQNRYEDCFHVHICDSNEENTQKIVEDISNYVTVWGNDVTYLSNSIPSASNISSPSLRHFKNYIDKKEGLKLNELPDSPDNKISVIGYKVFYDPDKRLWYSDIEIDPNPSYLPFIRLSLVRYQPNSIPGSHISNVEIPKPIQLLPSRSVSITRKDNTNSVISSIYGEMYVSNSNHSVEIRLEGLPLHSNNVWIPLETKKGNGPLPAIAEFSLKNNYNCNRFRFQLREYEIRKRDPNDSNENAERLVYEGLIYLYDDEETK